MRLPVNAATAKGGCAGKEVRKRVGVCVCAERLVEDLQAGVRLPVMLPRPRQAGVMGVGGRRGRGWMPQDAARRASQRHHIAWPEASGITCACFTFFHNVFTLFASNPLACDHRRSGWRWPAASATRASCCGASTPGRRATTLLRCGVDQHLLVDSLCLVSRHS